MVGINIFGKMCYAQVVNLLFLRNMGIRWKQIGYKQYLAAY